MLAPVFVALVTIAGSDLAVPSPAPLPVIGGSVADTCQWPATVRLGGCSGTLVHPEIVLYAAHCGSPNSVRFGVTGDERTVAVAYCAAAPRYPEIGFDYAYCRLSQAIDDVPIVPIMMGCERDELPVGMPVTLVGFGVTSNGGGGFGTKRWIEGTIAGFPNEGRIIGIFYEDLNTGICNGDSGGSAYVQLADGSWRMFGIASTVPGSCGGSSQHVPAWAAVDWIETHADLDISPCHDGDGTWNPSPGCTGFPLDPDDGSNLSWQDGCGPGLVSEAAQTCGPPTGASPDITPPTVEIVTPAPGRHAGPLFTTAIEIAATDEWSIREVTIAFDDEVQATFEAEPYDLPVVHFPEGTWEITATTRDWSGNLAEAIPVVIEVGMGELDGGSTGVGDTSEGTSSPDSATSSGIASDDGDGGSTTGEGASGGQANENDAGCGCATSPGAPWVASGLLLFALGRRRSTPSG